jgi:uncharacterized protein YbaA (DUF1428 family)
MHYVDGFVLAVPTANREAYVKMARAGAQGFLRHGALRVVECLGDDVPHGKLTDFHRAVQATPDEAVWFAWIEWPSKAVRDAGMAKVMEDPEFRMDPATMPFDGKRMIYGGFAARVDESTAGARP